MRQLAIPPAVIDRRYSPSCSTSIVSRVYFDNSNTSAGRNGSIRTSIPIFAVHQPCPLGEHFARADLSDHLHRRQPDLIIESPGRIGRNRFASILARSGQYRCSDEGFFSSRLCEQGFLEKRRTIADVNSPHSHFLNLTGTRLQSMRIDERTGNITDQPSTVGLMTGVLHHLAVSHDDGEQLALTEWRAR